MPTQWKKAWIAPVFKKGGRSDPANYHLVSLTSIACKMLEHILCTHIRRHLDNHEILGPENHRFRAKHSTETQLLLTTHDMMKSRDVGNQLDVMILEFQRRLTPSLTADCYANRSTTVSKASSSMDWVLPDWTYTISTCRWCTVEGGGSDVRCSPRYRPRTTPLYPLHKWPPSPGALSNTLPPLCGWLLAVSCHSFCSGPNPTPRWP